MNLKEKIPFLGSAGEEDGQGRVRLLGKLKEVEDFNPSDFNELVKSSIQAMENKCNGETVVLDDEIKDDIQKQDLLERHLSYTVKVTEGTVAGNGQEESIVKESSTFKVILRAQPNEAIEINGPDRISQPYKEALNETLADHNGEKITFQDIVAD
ncbi:MAG: hypothetical protein ABEJ25_01810 [Candidatus Bipolaricaulia bacterium]